MVMVISLPQATALILLIVMAMVIQVAAAHQGIRSLITTVMAQAAVLMLVMDMSFVLTVVALAILVLTLTIFGSRFHKIPF